MRVQQRTTCASKENPRREACRYLLLLLSLLSWAAPGAGAELVSGELQSDLVPAPVEYYALVPENVATGDAVPLILNLHGGGGSRDVLKRQRPWFEEMWNEGDLPPVVIVTPSVTPRCFYMDYRDGSQRWESFLLGPFLDHLRERFNVRSDRRGTMVTGISMGGMGALRLAFKHPDVFGAVAGLEPGISPIGDWNDIRDKHRFWRGDALLESIYGKPVDRDYWNANNPATLAQRNADALRSSTLKIFLEAGDADLFWLYEGAEYLHQVLWRERLRHEYRLYYDAEHVGRTLRPRTQAAYRFLAATLVDAEPDPAVTAARGRLDRLKRPLTEADHYGVDADLVTTPPKENP
ncbi:MAG: alpha/beta hydrolase-fold protein [Acidobacteriota bacterium]